MQQSLRETDATSNDEEDEMMDLDLGSRSNSPVDNGDLGYDDVDESNPDAEEDSNVIPVHFPPSIPYIEYHPRAGARCGRGSTFMDYFDTDQFSNERKENVYYPFSCRQDWEVGSWLLRSGLSMAKIDEFMSIEIIQNSNLSFSNAKELRGRAELLPSGPEWKCKPLMPEQPTKSPVHLYYRDPIDCLRALMRNPLHADVMEYIPYHVYKSAESAIRVYTEWMSGDIAWEMQDKLPEDATLLGTILSSDKTTISVMTGNRTAYPLLISLANIRKKYRLKNSHDTFLLLALLPVAKFINKNSRMRGLMHDRLIHSCLSFITGPLKDAAVIGVMMSDPLGFQRLCYTAVASYTVDTPEAQLLACVGGKTSPVTMAFYKEFGDTLKHEPRTASVTLAQLQVVKSKLTSTSDLTLQLKEAQKFRLNGVLEPFWKDWYMAEPCIFLTPEPLHHWHKQFWDHDARWAIAIVGAALIDFLYSLLQQRIGYRQFREGISSLKQVTGRDHREIQRYIIPIIACIAPKEVVFAIRSLMDLRYFGQSPAPDTFTCNQMLKALKDFHDNKSYISDAGGRIGKGGRRIEHWQIPKLELYQNVVPSIFANGAAEQWTADITEHAHHTDIKIPARSGNNQNYDTQIIRSLDRDDKCRRFDLATSIRDAAISLKHWVIGDEDDEDDLDNEGEYDDSIVNDAATLAAKIAPVSKKIFGTKRSLLDFFTTAHNLQNGNHGLSSSPVTPFRTFASQSVAFQLSRDSTFKMMSIDEAATLYALPDLRQSLINFVQHLHINGDTPCHVGGRRPRLTATLSSENIQIWCRLRIQNRGFHYPHEVLPPESLNCIPPSTTRPHGFYDTVIVNTDSHYEWPHSQLKGHSVVQLRMIMRLVPPKGSRFTAGLDGFLAYVQRFEIIPYIPLGSSSSGAFPDPISGMYGLRRSLRADRSRQGSIIQVKHIRKAVMLVPRFQKEVDPRLNKENCMESYDEFWLNDYFDKETFYSFRSKTA